MATKIEDEFAFLDVPAGGIDLEESPDADGSEDQSSQIMNPLTGCLVDTEDIDSLILACVDAKQQLADLHSFEDAIRRKLGSFTTGTAKTRRVKGKTLQAKLEMADDGWDQTILKEAWNSFEKYRDGYLKIGTISPQLREVKKLAEMATDDPAFGQFKGMIQAAVRPATGAPRVSLEKTE